MTALSTVRLLPYPAASHPSGQILFKGEDVLKMSDAALRAKRGAAVTMVFQEPMTSLNPLHTIERQIGEIMALHGGASPRARVVKLLEEVGIVDPTSRLGAFPHQLSGGQRQRVMIAMALANEPDLLIADEPTTALDVTVQAQILKLLKDIQTRRGMAMLFITHDLNIVRKIADDVAVMQRGQIVEIGPARAKCWPILSMNTPRPCWPPNRRVSQLIVDRTARAIVEAEDVAVLVPDQARLSSPHDRACKGSGRRLDPCARRRDGRRRRPIRLRQKHARPPAVLRLIRSEGTDRLLRQADRPFAHEADAAAAARDMQIVFQDPFGSLSRYAPGSLGPPKSSRKG